MELLLERCVFTSVSVMRPGNTMRRFFRENFFRTSTSRYVKSHVSFILLHICHVYGCGNRGIVYALAARPMKYLLKLKMLQHFRLFDRGFVVVG